MQLTFPPGVLVSIRQLTGHGSEYLSTALEKELKVLELCLMTTLLLFDLLRQFSFVSTFLTSLIKLILLLKFSTSKRQAENMIEGQGPYGPALFQN